MDEATYRADSAVSHSLLKEFSRSPVHFRYRNSTPVEETPQMLLGTVTHTMILEPDEVDARFVRAESCDRRTKAGKEKWAKLEQEAKDKRLIPAAVYDHARRMADAVDRDASSSMLLDEVRAGTIEKPLFWTRQGVACKGRPDAVTDDGTIVDIKTTKDASPKHFRNELFRRYYHTQGAFYRSGFLANGGQRWRAHILICVESETPHCVGVYRLGEETITHADSIISKWLNAYREATEHDRWDGYGFHEIDTPVWALAEAH